jgi:hypothetical protein
MDSINVILIKISWSLMLREERGSRVFENRVLRRIFEPRIKKSTGG